MSSTFRKTLTLLGCLAAASCASDETQFDIRYAPSFHPGLSVSIFGVFIDGRMSVDAWEELGPRLSPPLGRKICEVAYGSALVGSKPNLAAAVDDYARANGVTDDLLEEFGPMAKGETIMIVTMAGSTPRLADAGADPSPGAAARAQTSRGRGGRGRHAISAPPGDRKRVAEKGTLEISASLFSVRLRRSIALVAMTYSGTQRDEAIDNFRRKLETSLPGATCAGWDSMIDVDDRGIRDKIDP